MNVYSVERELLGQPKSFTACAGPLKERGIRTVTIERTSELEIRVRGRGDGSGRLDPYRHKKAGEFIEREPESVLQDEEGNRAVLSGYNTLRPIMQWGGPEAERGYTEIGCADEVTVTAPKEEACYLEEAFYLTDWLSNVPPGVPWPNFTARTRHPKFMLERHLGRIPESPSAELCRDHIPLAIPDLEPVCVHFGSADQSTAPSSLLPGFVTYESIGGRIPDLDTRARLIHALSFALGRQLVRVGTTVSDKDWRPLASSACRGFLVGGTRRYRDPFEPPCDLLGEPPELPTLNPGKLRRLVDGFLQRQQDCNLSHVLWLLWVGTMDPVTIAPPVLTSALEFMSKTLAGSGSGRSVRKSTWRKLRRRLERTLDDFDENQRDANEKEGLATIRKRLEWLNSRPPSLMMRMENFFGALDLTLCEKDWEALRARNASAHGSYNKRGSTKRLVEVRRTLRTLINRALLRLTAGAEDFIDYSAPGYPLRALCPMLAHVEPTRDRSSRSLRARCGARKSLRIAFLLSLAVAAIGVILWLTH